MINYKDIELKFDNKRDYLNHVVSNKKSLVSIKRSTLKKGHEINWTGSDSCVKHVSKQEIEGANKDELVVKAVMNTTNIFDSHYDVHLKGLWKKTIKENKRILHIQEHELALDKVISDREDLKVYTKDYQLKDLGFNYKGDTEALVFESNIKRNRNPFMYVQYKNGYVREHSVGMFYIQVELGVNDKEFKEEYAVWEKYSDQIANIDDALKVGFAWFVKEAKLVEGSAVTLGSNHVTPIVEEMKEGSLQDTQHDIESQECTFDSVKYIREFKF